MPVQRQLPVVCEDAIRPREPGEGKSSEKWEREVKPMMKPRPGPTAGYISEIGLANSMDRASGHRAGTPQ